MEGYFLRTNLDSRKGESPSPQTHSLKTMFVLSALLLASATGPAILAAQPPKPSQAEINDPFCTVSPEALEKMSPSTRKMSFLLERIAREMKPAVSVFMNRERAEHFRREAANATDELKRTHFQSFYALELLNAGESAEAVKQFQIAEKMARPHVSIFGGRFLASLVHYQAVAHLRIAEQQNCITNHNPESCLLPIAGAGVHKIQEGSRAAIATLEEQLKKVPRDRTGAWLLNL